MKNLVFLSLLVLIGCGDNIHNHAPLPEKLERPLFSGYFTLDGPSAANCIYLDEKIENIVDIESDCQSLVSTNPENNTVGQFPVIVRNTEIVINKEITFTRNYNYTSGHDLEEDVSGSNITGNRRTDVRLFFDDEGLLNIHIDIYKAADNSNLNEIVARRKFKEKR